VGGVAVQESGRIVTGGGVLQGADNANRDFALVGLTPAGELDPEFGADGIVKLAIAPGNEDDVIWAMTLDDDRILAAGESGGFDNATGDFALARFNEDSKLDASFGSGGIVTTPIGLDGGYNQPFGVAVQPDGKIVLAGECESATRPGSTSASPAIKAARASPDRTSREAAARCLPHHPASRKIRNSRLGPRAVRMAVRLPRALS
jgi:uncharacterized delta-60 repeat protein